MPEEVLACFVAGKKKIAPCDTASAVGVPHADGTKLQQGRTEALGDHVHVGDVPVSDGTAKEHVRSASDADDDSDFVIRTKTVHAKKSDTRSAAATPSKKRAHRCISSVEKVKSKK